jgi:hypothetical protein
LSSFSSHFQITPKNAIAWLVAFGAYVQNLGHLPEAPREWGMVVAGFLLSALVPSRDALSRKIPDEGPTTEDEGERE